MPAFAGMQWAPISDGENEWVMVGDAGIGEMACHSYMQINHRNPDWGIDGGDSHLKDRILCCEEQLSGGDEGDAGGGGIVFFANGDAD